MSDTDLYGSQSPFRRLPALSAGSALARQMGTYLVIGALVAAAVRAASGALPSVQIALSLPELGWGLAGVLAYAAYNAVIPQLLSRARPGKSLLGWMARRNLALFGKLPLWTLLMMAALAGPAEELIFRGWLQPVAGLWTASLVFALAHFPPSRYRWSHPATWGMIALYFPVGVLVGALYAWRGNLSAPILMHSLSDSLGVLVLARAVAKPRARSEPADTARP